MAIFNKAIRKITAFFKSLFEQDILSNLHLASHQDVLAQMNPVKDTHEEDIHTAGKEYLKSLLDKSDKAGEEEEKGDKENVKNEKLNKKRHARYNFNTNDIEVNAKEEVNDKTGSITVARSVKNAFNSDFTNYKSASNASAAAASKNIKKKIKKN